ncbi:MAG: Hemolysin, contains CBS domains [Chloroflexi bacterium]|nr:MAG: Hemolysin, contains CBS domains [Chloroflexota bacterium]
MALSLGAFTVASIMAAAVTSGRRESPAPNVGAHDSGAISERYPKLRQRKAAQLVLRFIPGVAAGFAFLALDPRSWPLAGALLLGLAFFLAIADRLLKRISQPWSGRFLPLAAFLIEALDRVVAPLAKVQRRLGPAEHRDESELWAELHGNSAQGNGGGDDEDQRVDAEELRMIRGILRMDEVVAREIMTPRVDVIAAEMNDPVLDIVDLMLEHGHSRIPIFEGQIDNVVGVLHARDLLPYVRNSQPPPLATLLRQPLFIPESKALDQLLDEFQDRRVHIAVVVDEYGGTAGLVTIEDLLEEIVGEISDEFDTEEPEIEEVAEGEAVMDARASLDQLNQRFHMDVQGEGFDTVGGLVLTELGKIPDPDDVLEYNGLRIKVLATRGRRIKKLHVARVVEP